MREPRDREIARVGRLQALLARDADAHLHMHDHRPGRGSRSSGRAGAGLGVRINAARTSASLIMPTSLAPSPMARVSGSGDTWCLTQPTRCRFCCGLARHAMTAERLPMMAANRFARCSSPNSTAMDGPSMAMATPTREITRPRACAAASVGGTRSALRPSRALSPPELSDPPSAACAARAAASLAASTSLVRRECSLAVSRSSSVSFASMCATMRLCALDSPCMRLSARSTSPSAAAAPAPTPALAGTGEGAGAAAWDDSSTSTSPPPR